MKDFKVAVVVAVCALTSSLPGCTESQADRKGTEAEARVREDGGIDIQAPGVDVKINTDGVSLGVDTDGDGGTQSN